MGYRSDVAFAIRNSFLKSKLESLPEEKKDLIVEFLEQADEIHEDFWNEEEDDGELEYWTLYKWNDWKWYDDRFVINWINNTVKIHGDDCSFVRIGERLEDIETFGLENDPFHLDFQRKIIHD